MFQICSYRERGFFWIRIYGYGFVIKDIRLNPLLFSERNKLYWALRFGNYYISFLNRNLSWKRKYHD